MPQIKISIPDEIYKQLKIKSNDNCRTLSEEITYILKKNYKKGGKQK